MGAEVRGMQEHLQAAERSDWEQLLIQELLETFASPDYHPPLLPGAALQLLQLSRDPSVPFSKVIALLQSEPLIAARVIRIAQSPIYSGGARILSIEDALLRLGIKAIALVFAEAAMNARIFSSATFQEPMQVLRRHSAATAHICSRLAQRLGQPGERLYLSGLLHDIGIAACLLVAPDLRSASGQGFTFEELCGPIHAVHERAAGVLGSIWELPEGLRWALVHHHDFVLRSHVSPIPALVCLASWIATEAGAGSIAAESAGDAAGAAADYFGWGKDLEQLLDLGGSIVDEIDRGEG